MDQRITIRIADKDYALKASSPQQEELIRRAAASINRKIAAFSEKYPGKEMVDILSFVALNEAMGSFGAQQSVDAVKAETESLLKDISSYLDSSK